MAAIEIRYGHRVGQQEAASRVKALVDDFAAERPELVKDVSWSRGGRRAIATGRGFKGSFEANEDAIVVSIDLSLLARPFKSKIESGIRRRLDEAFAG